MRPFLAVIRVACPEDVREFGRDRAVVSACGTSPLRMTIEGQRRGREVKEDLPGSGEGHVESWLPRDSEFECTGWALSSAASSSVGMGSASGTRPSWKGAPAFNATGRLPFGDGRSRCGQRKMGHGSNFFEWFRHFSVSNINGINHSAGRSPPSDSPVPTYYDEKKKTVSPDAGLRFR